MGGQTIAARRIGYPFCDFLLVRRSQVVGTEASMGCTFLSKLTRSFLFFSRLFFLACFSQLFFSALFSFIFSLFHLFAGAHTKEFSHTLRRSRSLPPIPSHHLGWDCWRRAGSSLRQPASTLFTQHTDGHPGAAAERALLRAKSALQQRGAVVSRGELIGMQIKSRSDTSTTCSSSSSRRQTSSCCRAGRRQQAPRKPNRRLRRRLQELSRTEGGRGPLPGRYHQTRGKTERAN